MIGVAENEAAIVIAGDEMAVVEGVAEVATVATIGKVVEMPVGMAAEIGNALPKVAKGLTRSECVKDALSRCSGAPPRCR